MIRDTLMMAIEEAANLAKCSYYTIHLANKKGGLAAYKPGKAVSILEKDLTDWFKSKRIYIVKFGRPRRRIEIHHG